MQQNTRPVRIPQSQTERSPDTTVEERPLTESLNTQPQNQDASSESLKGNQLELPKTKEEIKDIFRHEPLKRYRVEKLLKAAMPSTVRKRKYEEIVKSNEGDGMTESQQERMVRGFLQQEIKEKLQGVRRRRHSNSTINSNSSQGSFSESLDRVQPQVIVPPREALSQNSATPVIRHAPRRVRIDDSLSSNDSSNAAQQGSQPNWQPERPPTPDFEPLAPPPPPLPHQKPTTSKKTTQPRQKPPQKTRNIQSSSSSSSDDQQVPSPPPRPRRDSNEGTAHTNLGAPSRPHIPYAGASGLGVRSSKDVHGA